MDSVVLLLLAASNVLLLGISWLVVVCCFYCFVVGSQLGGRNSASIIWEGFCAAPLNKASQGVHQEWMKIFKF